MKKQFILAALCLFMASGMQAAEKGGNQGDTASKGAAAWKRIKEVCGNVFNVPESDSKWSLLDKVAMFGPFHGMEKKEPKFLSARNQALAFKAILAYFGGKWIVKKVKEYRKHKKHHQ